MKRLTALLLLATLCLSAIPAQAVGADLTWERIVDFALHMREMATGDYLDIKGVPENLQKVAEGWASGVNETPRLIVRLDVMNASYLIDTRAAFMAEPEMVRYEAECTSMTEIYQYVTFYASMEAAVDASAYEEVMEVNSLLDIMTIYAEEAPPETAFYVVLYDDAAPIFMIATAENDSVSLSGMFLPSDRLANCTNYGQVSMWFMLNGFAMTCEEVKPE